MSKHYAKIAAVETAKEVFVNRQRVLDEVRKDCLSRLSNPDASERLRIQQDLKFIDESTRQLNVGLKAFLYLPQTDQTHEPPRPQQDSISPHWMDRFNEFARMRVETWRQNLLAKALATEAAHPGTISLRALWLPFSISV